MKQYPLGQIEEHGFAIIPGVLSPAQADELLAALQATDRDGVRQRGAAVFAIRNILTSVPLVRELAASPTLCALTEPVLGPKAFAVRCIFFDKPPEANWKVPYHQDLAIAVQERQDIPGFEAWTQKSGVWHVHPPAELLEKMLTVRLHLDDCGETNGPLRVIPGSHRHGKLSATQIQQIRDESEEIVCAVPRGGALLMRPLLLHASSPATAPEHRRVLHIEYANHMLPDNLAWNHFIPCS